MPPKKIIDKGKGIPLEPISEKPEPKNTHQKTEPWITVTKKSAKKEEISATPKSLQTPEAIMNQMLQLQKAFRAQFYETRVRRIFQKLSFSSYFKI